MNLIVHQSTTLVEPEKVQSVAHTRIKHDWSGAPVQAIASFALVVDPSALHFGVKVDAPAWTFGDVEKGQFMEGLWERDIAEFFLCDAENPQRYQEFNLSPQGAWWTGLFKAPREPEAFVLPEPSYIQSCVSENAWSASIAIRLSDLAVRPIFDGSARLNVCFILGKDPRNYLSCSLLGGETPDFHQPVKFGLCKAKQLAF